MAMSIVRVLWINRSLNRVVLDTGMRDDHLASVQRPAILGRIQRSCGHRHPLGIAIVFRAVSSGIVHACGRGLVTGVASGG